MVESRTVLLVDDEEGILLAYLSCFGVESVSLQGGSTAMRGTREFAGYRFLVARSGEDAVALVEAQAAAGRRIACGFFDMKMPGGIDGVETIRRIRAADPQVLCTVVTAMVGESVEELHQLFAEGHRDEWDYLAKPFSRFEIVQKCRQMAESWNRRRREEEHVRIIRRLNRELEIWGESLERRVEERTAALAQSQRELRRKNGELEAVLEQLSSTQAQLVQHEKMASIGQLAAGVAQEIARPLELITQDLDALQANGGRIAALVAAMESLAPASPDVAAFLRRATAEFHVCHVVEAVPELVGEARIAVARIARVAGGLRAFGRPMLGDVAACRVNDVVRAAAGLARARLPCGARLEIELGDVANVPGDAPALQQALSNLLANAAHAVRERGAGGLVALRTLALADDVRVEVEDNGCGMSADLVTRIFEPFFTTRPNPEAAGLGLSIALGIVRRHGGDIEVTSAPEQGSRFVVVLPAAARESGTAPSRCVPDDMIRAVAGPA